VKRNRFPGFFICCIFFGMSAMQVRAGSVDLLTSPPDVMRPLKRVPAPSGICPQPRKTRNAPARMQEKRNPLPSSPENLERGRQLYYKDARPTECKLCHGIHGNGNGRLAPGLDPAPRNFTCSELMKTISDGQLFWIITHGSRGTAMPSHKGTLTETEIWQLIHFIRGFAE